MHLFENIFNLTIQADKGGVIFFNPFDTFRDLFPIIPTININIYSYTYNNYSITK